MGFELIIAGSNPASLVYIQHTRSDSMLEENHYYIQKKLAYPYELSKIDYLIESKRLVYECLLELSCLLTRRC